MKNFEIYFIPPHLELQKSSSGLSKGGRGKKEILRKSPGNYYGIYG